ncbi:MAG: hypothetical protein V1784_07040 [bacterium]
MAIYAQHGYGKSDKVDRGLQSGSLGGVILSPREETPENLQRYISDVRSRFHGMQILVDPQFYSTTMTPVRERHLPDYDYYRSGLTRSNFISPTEVSAYVEETLEFQRRLQLSYIVAPTVSFDDFRDIWSQTALQMGQEAVRYHSECRDPTPLLVSIVFSETALRSTQSLQEFLDIISLFQTTGFYVIVRRTTSQYQPHLDFNVLGNLLYLTYALAERNNYEVILGYTDIVGILLHAVGAKATACGWYSNLRQFSSARLEPQTGGRQPRPRYTSIPLLNSILVMPELVETSRVGLIDEVLSGTTLEQSLRRDPGNVPWPLDTSTLHHWEALHIATQDIVAQASVGARLTLALRWIQRAEAIYTNLQNRGVVFDYSSGPGHLDQWQRAIRTFRDTAGI